jgi:trimethylamine-N-oxide reductase (cytochrome c)
MMVLLQAMQGLGAPGRSIWGTTMGAPMYTDPWFPSYGEPEGRMSSATRVAKYIPQNPTKQRLWRLTVPEAILNGHDEWYGEGFCGRSLEQQFTHFTYPMEGHSEIKLWYRYGGSFIGTMSETNNWVRMYQSPKLEFVVNQDIWWQSETRMADVILPACTNFERDDVGEWAAINGYTVHASSGCNYRVVVREQKCIEPLWESKSDYQIFSLIAEKMGLRDEYTDGGKTEVDWVKGFFDISDLPKEISWEEFNTKGYHIINVPDDYKPTPGLRWFYEGRPCDTPDLGNPKRLTAQRAELGTFSGKIEFESVSLKQYFPDDEERPVVPRYIPSWEGHHTTELFAKYPLALVSPHPRMSFHCHYDKHTDWLNDIPAHRIKKDGYAWWPARINPEDAAPRGINNNDIVRLYNDRGSVLCIAVVTGRVRPGVIHSYASSALYDPLTPGDPNAIDKGGCVSILTPARMMSKNVPGMTPNSCLIEIEKWEG